MSQRPPGPCRAYQKGSCRFGTNCRFRHGVPPVASTSSSSHQRNSAASNSIQCPPVPPAGSSTSGQIPLGVCRVFWTAGACNRAFDCTFKHMRGTNAPAGHEDSPHHNDVPGSNDIPDIYSGQGLAISAGAISSERHTLTPVEAHNHMKPFLRDNYQFEKAGRIQGFVRILASVNDRNKAWNSDDALAFLGAMVTGNGILRIGDVLRFKPVSQCIGHGTNTLSFQHGYFPILEFLSSDLILKTTMHKNINHVYTVIEHNFDEVQAVVRSCIISMITAGTWKDTTPGLPPMLQSNLDGTLVFKALTTVYLQFLNRFKDSIKNHPDLVDFVHDYAEWFERWAVAVRANPPQFQDSITNAEPGVRKLIIDQLRDEVDRLVTIVNRDSEHAKKRTRQPAPTGMTAEQQRQARIAQLKYAYNAPGDLRDEGRRHDNDFSLISDVRVAPTHDELLCPVAPYLPVFLPDAPHHLPEHSMERHLDIQFRLLREELIASLRTSIVTIDNDVELMRQAAGKPKKKGEERTKLEQVLAKGGGAYKTSGFDSVFFRVYANVEFTPVKAERRDLTVGLELDTPPNGAARDKDAKKRQAYWEHSRLLQSGSLVALLVLLNNDSHYVYLGTITSFSKDIAEASKMVQDRIQVRVRFFDPEVELMALRKKSVSGRKMFLIDNDVMYEASRPFLERLQTIEPTEIPFARYIAQGGSLRDVQVLPPKYATAPRFRFKLSSLARKGVEKTLLHDLDISQPGAVELARTELLEYSELDPSQIDAVLNTATREVSLIQGPPGTGKSYTGRKLLQLLIASGVRPIVLIAYTNHALDHMLRGVLDERITDKLVRLGSRSSDEHIAEYTLDKLEKIAGTTNLDRSIGKQYGVMKRLEEQMSNVMRSIQEPVLSFAEVTKYLDIHHPELADSLATPPYWIQELAEIHWKDEKDNGEWQTAGKSKQKADDTDSFSQTLYDFWKQCLDIAYITPQISESGEGLSVHPRARQLFLDLGFGNAVPPIPSLSRPLDTLIDVAAMWSMSVVERFTLANHWEEEIRSLAYTTNLDAYERLRVSYREACKEYNDIRDETRRRLLSKVDIIGCTTTGAAKLISLLTSIAPRVLMVEEAGQVLEAHILTSLVTSVHHLICIGDPEQLRPTLATFALSMDSERGKELFKFDRSLMERLADNHLPMTQINVQRRMRPDISHFIRAILYPELEDHTLVAQYPRVQGMQNDVYFLNHINAENVAEDSASKYNMYEVNMVRDLVLYFLRQDEYSGPGDIAVLCAYLGQLQKVRQALRDLKIAVAVDERDEQQLARQGIDEEVNFEQVVVAKHISLGTVDIFQGREAKIVIVSLVRNTGTYETDSAVIGFLKSSNRINVALSRAKHGLYILGNASNLRKNKTWSTVLDGMEARGQIGPGLPIVCPRHPNQTQLVSQPGELSRFAPAGGCLLPCGTQLPCGHICPSVCHDTRDNHRSTQCNMPCMKIPCTRNHPCQKHCFEDCGDCNFPIYNVQLPCGHVKTQVPCHMLEKLDDAQCTTQVTKKLPRCEHSAALACHMDPAKYKCKELCSGILDCCGKTCKSRCNDCLNTTMLTTALAPIAHAVRRTAHRKHPCERPLYCHHPCGLDCEEDHRCNRACRGTCRQQCGHQKCSKPCSEPCPPCMEPCMWRCPHHECPVTCGSICSRLPCDEACSATLKCGHPCPSVCGEPCHDQICPVCAPTGRKSDVVDLIMQRTLQELDLSSTDVSERLITLACGHFFTVETLDGHCSMSEFYEVDEMGRFLSMKAPPTSYRLPPTCPTCRGPITALRYGRVTKRATLDILEQNVASNMSKMLESLNPDLERISDSLDKMKTDVKTIPTDMDNVTQPASSRESWLTEANVDALPFKFLDSGAMNSIHGFSPVETKGWSGVVKDIVRVYRRAHVLSATRGAHSKAYEGALATLYRLEMEAIAADPTRANDTPEPIALAAVKKKIGQPPPKADVRFQIDSTLTLIELRFMMAEVCASRIEALPLATHEAGVRHRSRWTSFATFLYRSCLDDSHKVLNMAKSSSASRQAAQCSIYAIRSEFERTRFQVTEDERSMNKPDVTVTRADRNKLGDTVKEAREHVLRTANEVKQEYIRSRPRDQLTTELQWFEDHCGMKVQRFMEELNELESFVRKGGLYQPLSMQEREMIVKAFDFGYTGHFYNCPNGHPYTIGECGGAMMTSRCPECGEEIGGGSHRLLSTNTRADEFETILRGTGAGQGFY